MDFVRRLLFLVAVLVVPFQWIAPAYAEVKAGFAFTDITPKLDGAPVYIAGYGQNRKATKVHDPLFARATVIEAGNHKVALASVDLVGLQYPVIERIRARLEGYSHVLVASTHSHEGPDVVGLWGPGVSQSGVDPAYIDLVIDRVVEAIEKANQTKQPAVARYGVANDKTLLRDSRPPYVFDDALRIVDFQDPTSQKSLGVLVVWGSHPESLGSRNQELTCDFPHVTVKRLETLKKCPVVYFSGSVGGLMTNPGEITAPDGRKVKDETFEYADVYGNLLADLAEKALGKAESINLEPIRIGKKVVSLPLENPTYYLVWNLGVLKRDAYQWLGDPNKIGEAVKLGTRGVKAALKTEVNYLAIGDLHVVGIPGELYPELLYGKIQEPVEPNADFPTAPLEKSVVELLPDKKIFFIGLANDEVGYIIPLRQWDWKAPYCYGSKDRLYGEINSCGSQVAPILMKALEEAVTTAK